MFFVEFLTNKMDIGVLGHRGPKINFEKEKWFSFYAIFLKLINSYNIAAQRQNYVIHVAASCRSSESCRFM